jgi:hypothetical protein
MSRPVAYLRVWFTTARPPPEANIETKLTCTNRHSFSESCFNRSMGGFGLNFGRVDNRKCFSDCRCREPLFFRAVGARRLSSAKPRGSDWISREN